MPSEAWSANPTPLNKSLESLKEAFKQRLDGILHKQLTVENIETFADEALSETVKLTDDILKEYRGNPNVYPNQIPLDKQAQENEAFAILNLPNISEILQSIIDVKSKIDTLAKYISENNIITNRVVIPPQHDSILKIEGNSGQGIEKKKLIPRLITLLYILETDFNIQKEQVKIIEGKVTPEMMRKTTYVRVEILDMERIVYICDEEGNASYVLDTDKLEEAQINIETLDISDKGIMNDLIAKHPRIGARIIQTKHWRTNMAELLGNDIPEKIQEYQEKPKSEFVKREKKEFLPFTEFQTEVRNLYRGEENIGKWYRKEQSKHPNWPSAPNVTYKNNWINWPELVERKNRLKIEYLSFDDLRKEVRLLCPIDVDNVSEWYHKEKPKHLNWPSNPNISYKNKGWQGWSELIGKENPNKKEFLSFQKFQKEIEALCPPEVSNVQEWYDEERLNHTNNWPSAPNVTYKNKGWQGWSELIGKENPNKKEFLPFEDFRKGVRVLYPPDIINVQEWYNEERKKHKNWPYSPNVFYRGKGWKSFLELVGKKKE